MSDIPSWAVRGSKVVCVEPDDWSIARSFINDPAGLMTFPVEGETYTIREVRVRYVSEQNEVLVGVLLNEVVNPVCDGGSATGEEAGWDIRSFAPVKHAKQSVEQRVEELV